MRERRKLSEEKRGRKVLAKRKPHGGIVSFRFVSFRFVSFNRETARAQSACARIIIEGQINWESCSSAIGVR